MTDLLVYNVEPASPSMIRSLDRHCVRREPDGTSAIDPARSHLNRVLVGSERGVLASLDAFYRDGVQRPTQQAESPYLRIVVSASAGYFRPDDPDAAGTWDEERLNAWVDATIAQLRAEHGDDLVHVELHLDEDTPHIHAVVAPTYTKKPRTPGRRKRNETEEEFEARKAAALAADGVRTVGRASHPELSKPGSFQRLRERMALSVDHLGIEYGEDRHGKADAKTTRQWVKEQAAELRDRQKRLDVRETRLDQQALAQDAHDKQLDEREKRIEKAAAGCKEWADELLQRETELIEREKLAERLIQQAVELLGTVADRLGVARRLDALREAVRKLTGPDDPFSATEDPGEETRPGF